MTPYFRTLILIMAGALLFNAIYHQQVVAITLSVLLILAVHFKYILGDEDGHE